MLLHPCLLSFAMSASNKEAKPRERNRQGRDDRRRKSMVSFETQGSYGSPAATSRNAVYQKRRPSRMLQQQQFEHIKERRNSNGLLEPSSRVEARAQYKDRNADELKQELHVSQHQVTALRSEVKQLLHQWAQTAEQNAALTAQISALTEMVGVHDATIAMLQTRVDMHEAAAADTSASHSRLDLSVKAAVATAIDAVGGSMTARSDPMLRLLQATSQVQQQRKQQQGSMTSRSDPMLRLVGGSTSPSKDGGGAKKSSAKKQAGRRKSVGFVGFAAASFETLDTLKRHDTFEKRFKAGQRRGSLASTWRRMDTNRADERDVWEIMGVPHDLTSRVHSKTHRNSATGSVIAWPKELELW